MLHLIYTYSEEQRPKRNGHTYKTVHIYRIMKNREVRLITHRTDTFVDEFQLVMMALEEAKALPARAFEKTPTGGHKYGARYLLAQANIAKISRIV